MYSYLNPEKALIFRIEHIDNLLWNLQENALYCRTSGKVNTAYVNIGNSDLISARASHPVPITPGGTLSDYVPFYFTPFSVMMYNIHTGRSVRQRHNREIVIFVSSIPKLCELDLEFIFTNQHAYVAGTEFYSSVDRLNEIDWSILQRRDFKKTDADPGKGQRYQAEALVHQSVPMSAILGVCCFDEPTKVKIEVMKAAANSRIDVHVASQMYF